jgi:UDPglucose 6-dehydrogenase
MTTLGLVGNGFVGGAATQLACDHVTLKVYDLDSTKCMPTDTTLGDVAACDLVFVAVPTPMDSKTGRCHTKFVESVIEDLKRLNKDCNIIVRSTCPPGFADTNSVHFLPEFLTEANANKDFVENNLWILGHNRIADKETEVPAILQSILTAARLAGNIKHDTLKVVTAREAELTKYVRNCYLSVKVSFFNEVYDVCKENSADFEIVRELVTADPRIGKSHSRVPGPDGKRGFGGHCLPKDIAAWCTFTQTDSFFSLVNTARHRNTNLDRKEKDWTSLKGRAII